MIITFEIFILKTFTNPALQLLALFFCLVLNTACTPNKPGFKSVDITGADYALGFKLSDADGNSRSLEDFKGKILLVFFGYTQCPDVCPTTLSELAQAKQLMGEAGQKVQAAFITLDPERDKPAILKAYMANFDSSFVALIPSAEQLPALAKSYKVFYQKVEGKTAGSYTFDHTAASFIYDTQGRLRLYTRYGLGAQALAHDLEILLKSSL